MTIFIVLLIGVIFFLLIRNNELFIDKKVLEKKTGSGQLEIASPVIISEYDNLISNYLKKRFDERNLIVTAALKGDRPEEMNYGFTQTMIALKHKYERVGQQREGLVRVSQKDSFSREKYGFVNEDGILVIPLSFTYADDFHESLAIVSPTARKDLQVFGGKLGAINMNGNYVLLPEYDDLRRFSEGLAAVMVNGKWGFINKEGKIVIEPQFLSIYDDFKDGLAIVEKEWCKWYFIQKNGEGNRLCNIYSL